MIHATFGRVQPQHSLLLQAFNLDSISFYVKLISHALELIENGSSYGFRDAAGTSGSQVFVPIAGESNVTCIRLIGIVPDLFHDLSGTVFLYFKVVTLLRQRLHQLR